MDTADIEILAEQLARADQDDVVVLVAAKEEARKKVQERPTAGNLAAFEKAKEVLERLIADNGPPAAVDEPCFPNRLEVYKHLKGQGYKIGRSKFYKQCPASGGMLTYEADGTILMASVREYIVAADLQKYGTSPKDLEKAQKLTLNRAEREVEKITEQVADLRRKREVEERKWIRREDHDLDMAAKIAMLEAGMRHLFFSRAEDWFEIFESEGLEASIEAMNLDLNDQFNRLAALDDSEVEFEGVDNGST